MSENWGKKFTCSKLKLRSVFCPRNDPTPIVEATKPIVVQKEPEATVVPTLKVQKQPVIAVSQIKLRKREVKYQENSDKALKKLSCKKPIFIVEREPGR